MTQPLTIGSLFSGIGGLELGLERAGLGPVIWQCETDPFCCEVLRRHWPEAARFNDVRDIIYLSPYNQTDIICGGFPCQDISNAGKRIGIEGERSSLWREFARVIGLVRPRFVVVENVSALLGRGMGAVLGDLATLGYDAEWDCIPAQAVGAPHRRDRVFVVAWDLPNTERDRIRERQQQAPNSRSPFVKLLGETMADGNGRRLEGQRRSGLFDGERSPFGDHVDRCGGKELADTAGTGLQRRGLIEESRSTHGQPPDPGQPWPPPPDDMRAWGRVQEDSQPSICRVAHGIPDRVDRLRSIGNSVVPQVAEVIGRRVLELSRGSGSL